jgi:hypothetical protein
MTNRRGCRQFCHYFGGKIAYGIQREFWSFGCLSEWFYCLFKIGSIFNKFFTGDIQKNLYPL